MKFFFFFQAQNLLEIMGTFIKYPNARRNAKSRRGIASSLGEKHGQIPLLYTGTQGRVEGCQAYRVKRAAFRLPERFSDIFMVEDSWVCQINHRDPHQGGKAPSPR
jgi:hypothetical protein